MMFMFGGEGSKSLSISVALAVLMVQLTVVISSDILSVYVTRKVLRKSIDTVNKFNNAEVTSKGSYSYILASILGLFAFDAIVVLTVAGYPGLLILLYSTFENSSMLVLTELSQQLSDLRIFILGALIMNITTALPTIAYLLLSVLITIHLLFWPAILRFLHNILESKIFEKRAVLIGVGVSMISIGIYSEKNVNLLSEFLGLLS